MVAIKQDFPNKNVVLSSYRLLLSESYFCIAVGLFIEKSESNLVDENPGK